MCAPLSAIQVIGLSSTALIVLLTFTVFRKLLLAHGRSPLKGRGWSQVSVNSESAINEFTSEHFCKFFRFSWISLIFDLQVFKFFQVCQLAHLWVHPSKRTTSFPKSSIPTYSQHVQRSESRSKGHLEGEKHGPIEGSQVLEAEEPERWEASGDQRTRASAYHHHEPGVRPAEASPEPEQRVQQDRNARYGQPLHHLPAQGKHRFLSDFFG